MAGLSAYVVPLEHRRAESLESAAMPQAFGGSGNRLGEAPATEMEAGI